MSTDFEKTHEILSEAFIGLSFEKIRKLALALDEFISPSLVRNWLNHPNSRFSNKSPISLAVELGDEALDRMIEVTQSVFCVGASR